MILPSAISNPFLNSWQNDCYLFFIWLETRRLIPIANRSHYLAFPHLSGVEYCPVSVKHMWSWPVCTEGPIIHVCTGITTALQEVQLDKHIRLLDSPGILLANRPAALQACMKTEEVDDPHGAVDRIIQRIPSKQLSKLYQVSDFNSADQFLQQLAAARGKLKKGGLPNTDVVARMVLQVCVLRREEEVMQ